MVEKYRVEMPNETDAVFALTYDVVKNIVMVGGYKRDLRILSKLVHKYLGFKAVDTIRQYHRQGVKYRYELNVISELDFRNRINSAAKKANFLPITGGIYKLA